LEFGRRGHTRRVAGMGKRGRGKRRRHKGKGDGSIEVWRMGESCVMGLWG